MNQDKIQRTLLDTIRAAGDFIQGQMKSGLSFEKKTEISIVTEADKACEKLILGRILKDFPNHSILAEESEAQERSSARWIIDPIDGTTNFAHGYPEACVSIAFEFEGELLLGGVFNPFHNELFFARKNEGAFLNEKRIYVSKTEKLESALLATGFPYDRRDYADEYLGIVKTFLMKCQGIRRSGSAALDFCHVACGRFDGYWEVGLSAWDKAAGILIANEAGAKTTCFQNKPLTIDGNQNLISNGLIHEEMLQAIRPHREVGLHR